MKKNILLFLIIFPILTLTAFKFHPITADYMDNGPKSVNSFYASNTTEKTIALQIEVFKRTMDNSGNDILVKTEDDFLVYPSQIVLEPGNEQRIRVQYKGPKLKSNEKAYRIIVNQMPIDFTKDDGGGLKILFRYIGSIYITPEKLNYEVLVSDIQKIDNQIEITLSNSGNSHTILKNSEITLRSGNTNIVLKKEDLEGLTGSNILAGSNRKYLLPWPDGLSENNLSGEIRFEVVR